jgi:ribonuclease I
MESIKQTAVEWLEDQIKNSKYYFKLMAEINSRSTVSQSNIFEQAKEMEKEQKIQAQLDVLYNALNSNNVKLSVEQTITELINGTIL